MPSNRSLTSRQARFVDEFLLDGVGTQAAIRAGFSEKGASVAGTRMLRNARVQAALAEHQAADAARLHIKRENVVAALLEAVETAREQKDPSTMVRALAEIGKLMGFYSPRQIEVMPVDMEQATMKRMSKMTDAELVAVIAGTTSS